MSTFNSGDRVIVVRYTDEVLSAESQSLIINQPGTVTKSTPEGVHVRLDNEVVGLFDWFFYRNELEGLL